MSARCVAGGAAAVAGTEQDAMMWKSSFKLSVCATGTVTRRCASGPWHTLVMIFMTRIRAKAAAKGGPTRSPSRY
eukprot:1077539-Rhodomonas_salina.2